MMLRFGTLPTNGRECVLEAVEALLSQVDAVCVVEAGANVIHRDYPDRVTVLQDTGDDFNISRWWNIGLDWAEAQAKATGATQWDTAVINDDAILPPTWMCYVSDDLRALGCVAGCSEGRDSTVNIHRHDGPVNLFTRLIGFAYVLVGESGLRADEDMKVWYQDDDLGARAAAAGGMARFPGCAPRHLYPSGQIGAAHQAQIDQDRATFIRKRGFVPW